MVTTAVDIITAQFGWGAKRHATQNGPVILQELGLLTSLSQKNHNISIKNLQANKLYSEGDNLNYPERLEQVALFANMLARQTHASIQANHFPIVLGGDHSIAIGTWSGIIQALSAAQAFGLIWIDAHMDSHTPATSPSMAIHGMPLAALLGKGEPALVNLGEAAPKLHPSQVVIIGVRSFEEGEAALLKNLQVKIYFIEEVQQRGFSTVFAEALTIVKKNTKGFGISLDLDGFDPLFAPGVGSPEKNGLDPKDFYQALQQLQTDPDFKALEIAEFNPIRDSEHKTANIIQHILKIMVN